MTRAIVIYPMNALANSQLGELNKFVNNVSGKTPITFARYTGQENKEERQHIANNPPDILLTNFMMLEPLMTRQDELDRKVIENCQGLRFLVLDELHTYRGRQGADVALLVRRIRERLAPENLQCIGTSATMASEGCEQNKQELVADVASKLFSLTVEPSDVITETLRRVTDSHRRAEHEELKRALGPAIDAGARDDIEDEALRQHSLAIWTETRLRVRRRLRTLSVNGFGTDSDVRTDPRRRSHCDSENLRQERWDRFAASRCPIVSPSPRDRVPSGHVERKRGVPAPRWTVAAKRA